MTYFDTQQQNPAHNPQFGPQQWGAFGSQTAQPYGAWASAPWMQAIGGYGPGGYGQAAYGQQYGQYGGQPSIGAFGYNAGWGAQPQGWGQQQQPQWGGQQQRQLSQQDVTEVVRQLAPALPQILAQAQSPHAAMGYAALPQFQSAFGAPGAWGQQQRQLTQQDVADITRQLIGVIPQVIGNLQAFNQQRMI